MNPASLMKIGGLLKKCAKNHPMVVKFLKNEVASGIPEGSVLELRVTKPGEEPKVTNMKVSADDLELIALARELSSKKK